MLQLELSFSSSALEPLSNAAIGDELALIFDALNRNYFENKIEVATIRWARKVKGRRRRYIRLGTYYFDDRTIRIHPALGLPWVPREVLEAVVFHEMCHAFVPSEKGPGNRRLHHGPKFKEKERSFPHYLGAKRWIRENLQRLLKVKF